MVPSKHYKFDHTTTRDSSSNEVEQEMIKHWVLAFFQNSVSTIIEENIHLWSVLQVDGAGFSILAVHKSGTLDGLKALIENPAQHSAGFP